MRADVKKYVQSYDNCIKSKAQKYKPYDSLQSLLILTHKWKNLSMDFVIGLLRAKTGNELSMTQSFSLLTDLQRWYITSWFSQSWISKNLPKY